VCLVFFFTAQLSKGSLKPARSLCSLLHLGCSMGALLLSRQWFPEWWPLFPRGHQLRWRDERSEVVVYDLIPPLAQSGIADGWGQE
jgi:hypothetical protein